MYLQFKSLFQAGLAIGKYAQVFTKSGAPIGMLRDTATGRFVSHAVGVAAHSTPLATMTVPVEAVMKMAQMYQNNQGFQKTYQELDIIKKGIDKTYQELDIVKKGIDQLQTSVSVLQSTTNLIGVGVAFTGALAAVNLWQTFKLREDVKNLRIDVKNGFIDLKTALRDQGQEVLSRIDSVSKDIKFEIHRTKFYEAYGQFKQASKQINHAMLITDDDLRKLQLVNAYQTLGNALAIYDNPQLLSETCAAGKLRRLECAWAIEQTQALVYSLQNQPHALSSHLDHLNNKIQQDCLSIIDQCSSQEELDFLFPEIARIQYHDVAVLESWKNHTDWMQTLSPSEKEELANLEPPKPETIETPPENTAITEPVEMQQYQELKQKSHYSALQDQLRFIVKPELRQNHQSYITEQATKTGRKALVPQNWQDIPDVTVANLYYYFKNQEKSA